jgi:tripartite-type tricarboxylate transporter receptor subunit TctC
VLPNLSFDTLRDLAPVMLIGTSPMVITSHPATVYWSFTDLVAAARKSEGTVNYGTIGAGSLAHLAMTSIANGLKVTMTHISYRGGGPLLTDAIAGHIPVAIASIALLSPQISGGGLRALAVTSAARYPQFPDIPTVNEFGIEIDAQSWWGMVAPARTPPHIIARMHDALAKALEVEAVRRSLSEQGVIYRLSSPEELGRFVAAEIARWANVVKDNRIVASE